MKKQLRLICLMLALVLFLLPGCAADRPEITTDAAETTVIPEETTAADLFDVPGRKDIYFATGNDYYDLYADYSLVPGPEITLLSREYIDPDSIHVSVDIQADYSVFVTPQETGASLTTYSVFENDEKRVAQEVSRGVHDFPLYLYQTYAGIDWADVGQKYMEYYDIMAKHAAGEAAADQVETALNQYNYAATEFINDYSQLAVDDLPTYYEYLIQVFIDRVEIDEEFTTVQVTIDDTVYDVEIGKVYIRQSPEVQSGRDYFSTAIGSPYWLNSFPYGRGVEQCQSATFLAKEAITLTGLRFLENTTSTAKVLEIVAVIADDEAEAYMGNGIKIKWDGITPIYVEKGKYVTFHMTFQDDRLKEINYHSSIYPVWEFECDGAVYEQVEEIPLFRYYGDRWLLYAMGIGGLDMESYFNDYHYQTATELWRNDVDLTPWGQKK